MFYGDFTGDKHDRFVEAIKTAGESFRNTFAADNLIAFDRNLTFLSDPRFSGAFTRNSNSTQENSIAWRLHVLTWAAQQALKVPGDYVECGVLYGHCMAVVAAYLDFAKLDRTLYLYDTFEGIPPEFNSENRSQEYFDELKSIASVVRERFAPYPNVNIVEGIVPHTFAQTCPDKIAFLHIDMNSSASEIAALNHLYDRVSPGGFIIFDDFGWSAYQAQTIAELAFMAERKQHILELPTGQGLLIKTP